MDQPFVFFQFNFKILKSEGGTFLSHVMHRLVALLVVVPCSAFPRVSRLTNEEIHQQVEKKGWAKTRWNLGRIHHRTPRFEQGGQTGGLRSWEMSKDDGHLSRGRPLLRSVRFFLFYSWSLQLRATAEMTAVFVTSRSNAKKIMRRSLKLKLRWFHTWYLSFCWHQHNFQLTPKTH